MLLVAPAGAQNLVPNGSFEAYANCPLSLGEFSEVLSWSLVNGHTGSPDFYDACNNSPFAADVPGNAVGFQYAASGKGYAGMLTWQASQNGDFREYIQTILKSPMVAGKCYRVSYKYSLADIYPGGADGFGVLFTPFAINAGGTFGPLPFTPQIQHPANVYMNDSVHWVTETYTYTANGTEKWMTLGNFKSNANTHHPQSGSWIGAYIYLDDIRVVACDEPVPYLRAFPDTLCPGMYAKLWAVGDVEEVWWSEVQHPLDTLSTDTVLTVQPLTNARYILHSSYYNDTIAVTLLGGCEKEPVIPNVFSPNGDGQNDAWKIALDTADRIEAFEIYNRWGNLITKLNPAQAAATHTVEWNGETLAGTKSVSGVYYFVLVYVDQHNKEQRRQGCISLFR